MSLEIELPIADLKAVLPGLSQVINKSSSLPVLGCVRASVDNGEVNLQVTNLDDTATVSIGRCGAGSGAVLVPLEELKKSVKGCSGDQFIRLSAKNEESVLNYPIGASRADRRLDFIKPEDWPEAPQVNQHGIPVTEAMQEALLHAFDCSSEDPSRYVLQGAFLDVRDPKTNYVVGTNGHVLFSANSFRLGLKESLIVPNRKFLHWKGLFEDGNVQLSSLSPVKAVPGTKGKGKIEERPGWVQFKSDRWTFVTRQIEGEYPSWKHVIPAEWKTKVILSKEAIQFIQGVVPKMPCNDSADMPIYLVVENGAVSLSSRVHASDPWTTLPVFGAVFEGKAVTVALNRNFLVRAMEFGLDEITLTDELSAVTFQKDGRKLVIMVLRLDGSPTRPESEIKAVTTENAPTPAIQPSMLTSAKAPITQPPKEATSGGTTQGRNSSMTKETSTVEQPQSRNGNNEEADKPQSAFDQLQEQVENIRTALKDVVADLNEVGKLVTQAHREKRATEKEMVSIRESVQEIQRIKI